MKYNIGICTSLQARRAFIQISQFHEQEGLSFDNCSMPESLHEHQTRSIELKERISAVIHQTEKIDHNLLTFKLSDSNNQDSEMNEHSLGNIHLKCTKDNFETLLCVYPANVESQTPTVSAFC